MGRGGEAGEMVRNKMLFVYYFIVKHSSTNIYIFSYQLKILCWFRWKCQSHIFWYRIIRSEIRWSCRI